MESGLKPGTSRGDSFTQAFPPIFAFPDKFRGIWSSGIMLMSLRLNMLSRLVITFLPRSKRLLISWLQSPSAVILEPPKIKSDTVSTVSPSIWHNLVSGCYGCSRCFKVILSLLSTSMDALERCVLNCADYTHQQFVSFD